MFRIMRVRWEQAVLLILMVFPLYVYADMSENVYVNSKANITCKLPVFEKSEEITESSNVGGDYVAFQFEGLGFYSRNNKNYSALLPAQYNESIEIRDLLLKMEEKHEKEYFNVYDVLLVESEFVVIDGVTYRLYIANTGFDGKISSSTAELFTLLDDEVIYYKLTFFSNLESQILRKRILEFRAKCNN